MGIMKLIFNIFLFLLFFSGMLQPTTSLMPLLLPLRLPENPCGQPHNRHQLRACQPA
jgi:hypothetical protein